MGLRAGLKVIILRGVTEEDSDEHGVVDGVIDAGGTVAVELGGGGDSVDVDGRDKELIFVDKEVEGYREVRKW